MVRPAKLSCYCTVHLDGTVAGKFCGGAFLKPPSRNLLSSPQPFGTLRNWSRYSAIEEAMLLRERAEGDRETAQV